MATIKRWRNNFITWLYIRYVFLPDLFEKIAEGEYPPGVIFTVNSLNPEWDDIETAIREKDYNTIQ